MADVKNRDIELLKSILFIMQNVRALEERREWEKERANNVTQHLSFMPRGGGVPSGLDRVFAKLSELEDEHRDKVMTYARELKKAENILNDIQNENMRTFVMMMYVEQIPATEVRERLNMTRRKFLNAKNAVESAECMADVRWPKDQGEWV